MSHQGCEGWFPECIACGMGNLRGIVCLSPLCHESHQGEVVEQTEPRLTHSDGHAWKSCHWGDTLVRSDPFSWGTFALCVECWNQFARRRELPPNPPLQPTSGGGTRSVTAVHSAPAARG